MASLGNSTKHTKELHRSFSNSSNRQKKEYSQTHYKKPPSPDTNIRQRQYKKKNYRPVSGASYVVLVVNIPANVGDRRDTGSVNLASEHISLMNIDTTFKTKYWIKLDGWHG